MRRFWTLAVLLLVILVLAIGCGAAKKEYSAADYASNASSPSAKSDAVYDRGGTAAGSYGQEQSAAEDGNLADNRKVIKNADMSIEINDLEDKVKDIEAEVSKYGGYIGESNMGKDSSGRVWANMVLRLPAKDFEVFIAYLEDMGNVRNRRIYRDDVTMQFVDLEARLKVLKAEEESLVEILRKATKMEDILSIRRELRSLRSEIEAREGELNYLSRRVDYSTIHLNIQQPRTPESHIDATGLTGVWQQGVYAFTRSTNVLISLVRSGIVAAFAVLPLALPPAVFVLAFLYWRRKKKMDKNVS